MRFQLFLAWLALIIAASWPLLTSSESLWVDELHSAWVIDGPWNDLIHRAAIGNQSGLYFGGLKLWQRSLHAVLSSVGWSVPPELELRLFSWIGWVAIVGWLGFSLRHHVSILFIMAAWLWLDRIGSFYAIETRPYVWVALLSILLMSSATRIPNDAQRIHWSWVLWATLIFYVHYTSMIVVAFSMFALCLDLFLTSIRDRSKFLATIRYRVLEGVVLIVLSIPGLICLVKIGGQSQQWNDFAGDYSFYSIVELLPWLAWCVFPAVFLIGERVVQRSWFGRGRFELPISHPLPPGPARGRKACLAVDPTDETISLGLVNDRRWLIQAGFVGFGVMIAVWSLTILGIAPLMHRRYAIGAYPALLIVGAYFISQLRSRSGILMVGSVSLIFLGWTQGTFREWNHGRWLAWQRQEDWRLTAEYLAKNGSVDDSIFVAPMLIETKGAELAVDLPVDYLTAPLKTHYQISLGQRLVPLPNDPGGWNNPIVSELEKTKAKSAWVVVRSSIPHRFAGPLRRLTSESSSEKSILLTPILNAGRVQLFHATPLQKEP